VHTSIAGLLHDVAVHEFKRQEFLRNVAEIVGAAPAPELDPTEVAVHMPIPALGSTRTFLKGVDQVLRDAARA
jgi:hypothetical protein